MKINEIIIDTKTGVQTITEGEGIPSKPMPIFRDFGKEIDDLKAKVTALESK